MLLRGGSERVQNSDTRGDLSEPGRELVLKDWLCHSLASLRADARPWILEIRDQVLLPLASSEHVVLELLGRRPEDDFVDIDVGGLDDVDLVIQAALDGAGLAWVTEDRIAQHLESGALIRVLEDWCPPFPGFFLYYPTRKQQPAALTALITTLRLVG